MSRNRHAQFEAEVTRLLGERHGRLVIDWQAALGVARRVAREWPDVSPAEFVGGYLALRESGEGLPTAAAVVRQVHDGCRPSRPGGGAADRATQRVT